MNKLSELKEHLLELQESQKSKNGGLEMAKACVGSPEFDLVENAIESFDAADLIVQLINAVTVNHHLIGFTVREFTRELDAFYKCEIKKRIQEVEATIDDFDGFDQFEENKYESISLDIQRLVK